ncbi:hypothetical protein, partial [Mesorhizobium sp. P5_C1]
VDDGPGLQDARDHGVGGRGANVSRPRVRFDQVKPWPPYNERRQGFFIMRETSCAISRRRRFSAGGLWVASKKPGLLTVRFAGG